MVVGNETWLSAKLGNNELFECIKRFNVYHCVRGIKCGGGVLIAVADNLFSSSVDVASNLALLWVELHAC